MCDLQKFRNVPGFFDRTPLVGQRSQVIYFNHIRAQPIGREKNARVPFRSSSRCTYIYIKKKNISFLFHCYEQTGRNTNVQSELIDMQVSNAALTNTRVTMVFNNATNCDRLSAASLDSCANARLSTSKSTNARLIAGELELVSFCEINCRFLPACQPHCPATRVQKPVPAMQHLAKKKTYHRVMLCNFCNYCIVYFYFCTVDQ